ncbi:TPA: hypothetical protein G9F10_004033 [Salmonella enterica]|nr:hypothetical protein [Salmonella enterica subsp. enterica serovar Menston]MIX29320.1 hypothetical protein [Salmonella enterica subsp. enterica serovar Livingstone]HAF4865889.1 hypothetical protein [Salmonella enterica]
MNHSSVIDDSGPVTPAAGYRPLRGITLGINETNYWALIVGVVVAVVLGALAAVYSHIHANNEMETIQTIITTTENDLSENGIYDYDGASDMTGTLARSGGLPSTITIVGDADSGSATLLNTWKGALTVEPVAGSDGTNTSFLVREEEVPEDACFQLATGVSSAGLTTKVSVNGTETDGVLAKSDASTQCTADEGGKGTNTLEFTVAG